MKLDLFQVVAGTVFKFDAIFKYEGDCGENNGKKTTCKNFNIFRPLPYQCTDAEKAKTGLDSCLKTLRDRGQIECDDPQSEEGLPGGFSCAEEPEEIDDIKALATAESALLFAGGLTETCKVSLDSLTNFQSQVSVLKHGF